MTNRDSWSTPQWLFDELNEEFTFTLDVAADATNAKCRKYKYHDPDDDLPGYHNGLCIDWRHDSIWCNPPYSNIGPWVEKAATTKWNKNCGAVLLIPAMSIATAYWRDHMASGQCVLRFPDKRVQFIPPPGVKASTNPGPSMICIFGYDDNVKGWKKNV